VTDDTTSPRYTLRPSVGGYFAIYDESTGSVARFNETWLDMLTKDEAVAVIEQLVRLDREQRGSTKQ
jgi:hypothetical protein